MFLSRDDIKILTGYSYPKKQIGWLREHRYEFEVDRKGRPIVLLAHIESRLNGITKKSKRCTEPNWDSVRGL